MYGQFAVTHLRDNLIHVINAEILVTLKFAVYNVPFNFTDNFTKYSSESVLRHAAHPCLSCSIKFAVHAMSLIFFQNLNMSVITYKQIINNLNPVIFFCFLGLVPVPTELGKIVPFYPKIGKFSSPHHILLSVLGNRDLFFNRRTNLGKSGNSQNNNCKRKVETLWAIFSEYFELHDFKRAHTPGNSWVIL